MNNKIRINSLLLLVIYMLSTKISATDQIDLLEEIKLSEINIELCEKNISKNNNLEEKTELGVYKFIAKNKLFLN